MDGLAFLLNLEIVRAGPKAAQLCDDLLGKIELLRKSSDGYLTNAGRFEWVDSALVKVINANF